MIQLILRDCSRLNFPDGLPEKVNRAALALYSRGAVAGYVEVLPEHKPQLENERIKQNEATQV